MSKEGGVCWCTGKEEDVEDWWVVVWMIGLEQAIHQTAERQMRAQRDGTLTVDVWATSLSTFFKLGFHCVPWLFWLSWILPCRLGWPYKLVLIDSFYSLRSMLIERMEGRCLQRKCELSLRGEKPPCSSLVSKHPLEMWMDIHSDTVRTVWACGRGDYVILAEER